MTTEQILITAITGLLSAGLGGFTSLLITRKSKYLETITSERIKWITSIRNELTRLAASLLVTTKHQHTYKSRTSDKHQFDDAFRATGRDPDMLSHDLAYERSRIIDDIHALESLLENALKPGEMIELAYLLKLKFNPTDDRDIIAQLDAAIKFISSTSEEQSIHLPNFSIDALVDCSQLVLKREWDKVKSEAKSLFSI